MLVRPVVDAVLPGAPGPPFQPDELGQELRVPEELDFERPRRRRRRSEEEEDWMPEDERHRDDDRDEFWKR